MMSSRDAPQDDRSSSDIVMICIDFNSNTTLDMLFKYTFIKSVLFCFVFKHESTYTRRVLAVFGFYYRT